MKREKHDCGKSHNNQESRRRCSAAYNKRSDKDREAERRVVGEAPIPYKNPQKLIGIELAAKVIRDQFAVQQKIFGMLNAFASGAHLKQFGRVDHESIIAQVYGDLAAHFAELKAAAEGK